MKGKGGFLEPDEFLQEIDNLSFDKKQSKKKINCKNKGDRVELQLIKKLSSHFNKPFSKTLGSGSRWSQVNCLPEHAKKTLTGDICAPEGFKWVVECKGGYEDKIDLASAVFGRIPTLDSFIQQALHYSDYCKLHPLICWKRNHKPWLSFVPIELFPADQLENSSAKIIYFGWVCFGLDDLLNFPNDFWFDSDFSK